MAPGCTPLIARQTGPVERALRYDERPIDNTPRHTTELPDTPTRDRNIPATAWIEAPAALLALGDDLWEARDDDLVELATRELEALGLVPADAVENGWVVRVPKAYPMYDENYAERVAAIRAWLDTIPNLQQVGRNGLHRYNNSDHSMLTAIRAVENLLHGADHDLWRVNADGVYLEEGELEEQPYLRLPDAPAAARR